MFLPEIHQTQWGEKWAQLEKAKRAGGTSAQKALIKAQIREHMKHQYEIDQPRRELERSYPTADQAKMPDESSVPAFIDDDTPLSLSDCSCVLRVHLSDELEVQSWVISDSPPE